MDDTKNLQDQADAVEKIEEDVEVLAEPEKFEDESVEQKEQEGDMKKDEAVEDSKEKQKDVEVEVAPIKGDVVDEVKKDEAVPPTEDSAHVAVETPVATTPGQWYVIHVKTSYEGRVQESLGQRIKSLGVEDKIFEIVIPVRDIIVVKKGKKTNVKEKVFPGYIFVKMILDDDSWLVVRTTQGVTGFVGAGTKPTPITEREVAAIMKFIQQEQPKFKTKFSTGEAVKIIEGPFSDFLGTVESIDDERGKVKVLVSIFDRETPVELDFLQVSKL